MGNLKFGTDSPLALYMGVSGSTKAYYGTTVVYSGGTPIDYSQEYLTFEILTGGTIEWIANTDAAATADTEIHYSINDSGWTTINATTGGTSFNVSAGDIVKFKGDTKGNGWKDTGDYKCFGGTAYFNISGNIVSIANSTGYTTYTLSGSKNFKGLFSNTNVVSAEHLWLPSDQTTDFYYRALFSGCQYLTTAPLETSIGVLSGLGCATMFKDCVSLVVPPILKNASSSRYSSREFEEMFSGCIALYQAPELTMAFEKYGTCIKMFSGCTSLNYVKCTSTVITGALAFNNWLSGVSATGTFIKDASTTWSSGVSGIPTNWTVVDAV